MLWIRALKVSFGVLVALGLALVGVGASGFSAQAAPGAKVTICHTTSSAGNPYVQQQVDADSIVSGGGGHGNSGVNPGDIIPPFTYTTASGAPATYPGQNWPAGEATWNNGCHVPTSTTAAAPTFLDPCGTANDTYTIPATTDVEYHDATGAVLTTGTHPATGTITITAVALKGHTLTGTTSWTHTYDTTTCGKNPNPPATPPGQGTPPSQPGHSTPPSQPGHATPPSQPEHATPASQPGAASGGDDQGAHLASAHPEFGTGVTAPTATASADRDGSGPLGLNLTLLAGLCLSLLGSAGLILVRAGRRAGAHR